MYYGRGLNLLWDPTYLLIIIGAVISLGASAWMKSTFNKYSRRLSASGISGRETALRILNAAGIPNVRIGAVAGSLTDHYDPRTKVVNLSQTIYGRNSLAAIGVAAHECGHAIQDASNYMPLRLRSEIVPVVNIGSSLSWPVFILGLLFSIKPLTTIGIVLFSLAVLFQLITLPVELDASRRALVMLERTGIVGEQENREVRKVLTAAAMTYVAALAASVLQLLRLVLLARGRSRND